MKRHRSSLSLSVSLSLSPEGTERLRSAYVWVMEMRQGKRQYSSFSSSGCGTVFLFLPFFVLFLSFSPLQSFYLAYFTILPLFSCFCCPFFIFLNSFCEEIIIFNTFWGCYNTISEFCYSFLENLDGMREILFIKWRITVRGQYAWFRLNKSHNRAS